jgi:hypothetical protein
VHFTTGKPGQRRKAGDRRDVNRVFAHRSSRNQQKTSRLSPGSHASAHVKEDIGMIMIAFFFVVWPSEWHQQTNCY